MRPTPVIDTSPPIKSESLKKAETHLKNLTTAQKYYKKKTGRWSSTIKTLVNSEYLSKESGDILTNTVKLEGWTFAIVTDLPFPDEDVSWCYTAHGPNGRIILASHSGMWERHDGKLSIELDTLPPSKPWKKIIE